MKTDKTIIDKSSLSSRNADFIKNQRGNLTSSAIKPIAYELELMESFARNHQNAAVTMPLMTLVVAMVAYSWIGTAVASFWFSASTLAYMLLIYMCQRFLRDNERSEKLDYWRRVFLLAQFLISVCWCVYALAQPVNGNVDTFTIIQFSSLLVIQAVTTMLSSGVRQSVLIVCTPPTLILSTRFMFPYAPDMMLMSGILMGSLIFFFVLSDRFKLSVLSELQHRDENETLIAELETARAISEEARRRAEDSNLAKSRFLATMSHELRTPLNAILGFSEIMKNEVLGPMANDTYKQYSGDIHSSGDHLLNVINEILDLSRIEAGRQELSESAIRLGYVVEEARNMNQMKAKHKGITIALNIEPDLPRLWADERAIRQVALNLLSNAVKFTPTGGHVAVNVGWTSTGGQYLSVSDNGPGIPEEEIPIVLSSFGQGAIAIKSAEQGSGLGLPIVQALLHQHEGRFELKSKLREGTTTIATFPRHRIMEEMRPVAV